MPDEITSADLYGPSTPPQPEDDQTPVVVTPPTPIPPVEETPEIPMPPPVVPLVPTPATPAPPYHNPKPGLSTGSIIGLMIMFAGLFGLGMWLSNFFRQYTSPATTQPAAVQQTTGNSPTPASPGADETSAWKTYQVVNAAGQPFEGISFKVPSTVLAPVCDGAACMSLGTYLPGGTRLTVAPRGVGQQLPDMRTGTISDAAGMTLTSSDSTVLGHTAKLFTGGPGGTTAGGYGFSQIRGYMIEVTPDLSLEINHFSPSGVTADFAADDTLFDQIVSSLTFGPSGNN